MISAKIWHLQKLPFVLPKLVQLCCVPRIQEVMGAAEGSGSATCDDGLLLRVAPPTFVLDTILLCLPPLPCGNDPGATCCADGDACFGTDGFGTPLTCVEGTCERCGLRGTPPCDGVNSSDVAPQATSLCEHACHACDKGDEEHEYTTKYQHISSYATLAPVVPLEALTSSGYVIRVFDAQKFVPYDYCSDRDQKEQTAQARYNAGRDPCRVTGNGCFLTACCSEACK